jgi:hypothetical protein
VRRGAASCRAMLAAVQWRRRSGRGAGAITAEPSWVERPGRRDRARSDCPAGGRRSRGCPDAGQAGRCPVRLVRSTVGMSVQPVERTSGVQASGVQASGASRCPDGQALVSAALPPRDPRRAGLWSGSVGRAAQAGRSESTCPVSAGGVVACPHRAGRKGRGRRWPCLPRTTVDRSQGRRLAGVPAAAPPGRRADRGCWSRARVPAGWRGSMGQSRCSQALAGRPGLVAGVMPGHGPGPRGGDHAGWLLGLWWSRVFQLRRAHSVRWGAACGRSAAAAREERCPLAADRSLTS